MMVYLWYCEKRAAKKKRSEKLLREKIEDRKETDGNENKERNVREKVKKKLFLYYKEGSRMQNCDKKTATK